MKLTNVKTYKQAGFAFYCTDKEDARVASARDEILAGIKRHHHALLVADQGWITFDNSPRFVFVGPLKGNRQARKLLMECVPQPKSHELEEEAKAKLIEMGYGPRWYAGKCHAIKGLKPGETYYQEQFPGGYHSWQETLEAIQS